MAPNNAQFTPEEPDGRRYFGRKGGAGCIVLAQSTGRFLLFKRSANVEEPHTWGTWGGAIEEGCTPARTAADELFEETGYDRAMKLEKLCEYRSPGGSFTFHNYLAIVPDEYEPWDSHENEAHAWVEFGDWPQDLHFGLEYLLSHPTAQQILADRVSAVKSGQDLVTGAPHAERTLYHALYKDPQGDALLPLSDRTVNGRRDNFLFATHHFSKAMAYAFSYHNRQDIGGNGQIDGTPDEFAIVCTRDKTMNEPRNLRIYSFSSNGFEPMDGCPSIARQWVSTSAVKFKDTELCYETTDVHELMRRGLQIISVAMGPDEFYSSGLADKYWNTPGPSENMLAAMIRDGVGKWENKERTHPNGVSSLRPNEKIQAALDALTGRKPAGPGPAP
jgi:8-oxo-dGTP pyrophosphatase MutT (NUDIX family)